MFSTSGKSVQFSKSEANTCSCGLCECGTCIFDEMISKAKKVLELTPSLAPMSAVSQQRTGMRNNCPINMCDGSLNLSLSTNRNSRTLTPSRSRPSSCICKPKTIQSSSLCRPCGPPVRFSKPPKRCPCVYNLLDAPFRKETIPGCTCLKCLCKPIARAAEKLSIATPPKVNEVLAKDEKEGSDRKYQVEKQTETKLEDEGRGSDGKVEAQAKLDRCECPEKPCKAPHGEPDEEDYCQCPEKPCQQPGDTGVQVGKPASPDDGELMLRVDEDDEEKVIATHDASVSVKFSKSSTAKEPSAGPMSEQASSVLKSVSAPESRTDEPLARNMPIIASPAPENVNAKQSYADPLLSKDMPARPSPGPKNASTKQSVSFTTTPLAAGASYSAISKPGILPPSSPVALPAALLATPPAAPPAAPLAAPLSARPSCATAASARPSCTGASASAKSSCAENFASAMGSRTEIPVSAKPSCAGASVSARPSCAGTSVSARPSCTGTSVAARPSCGGTAVSATPSCGGTAVSAPPSSAVASVSATPSSAVAPVSATPSSAVAPVSATPSSAVAPVSAEPSRAETLVSATKNISEKPSAASGAPSGAKVSIKVPSKEVIAPQKSITLSEDDDWSCEPTCPRAIRLLNAKMLAESSSKTSSAEQRALPSTPKAETPAGEPVGSPAIVPAGSPAKVSADGPAKVSADGPAKVPADGPADGSAKVPAGGPAEGQEVGPIEGQAVGPAEAEGQAVGPAGGPAASQAGGSVGGLLGITPKVSFAGDPIIQAPTVVARASMGESISCGGIPPTRSLTVKSSCGGVAPSSPKASQSESLPAKPSLAEASPSKNVAPSKQGFSGGVSPLPEKVSGDESLTAKLSSETPANIVTPVVKVSSLPASVAENEREIDICGEGNVCACEVCSCDSCTFKSLETKECSCEVCQCSSDNIREDMSLCECGVTCDCPDDDGSEECICGHTCVCPEDEKDEIGEKGEKREKYEKGEKDKEIQVIKEVSPTKSNCVCKGICTCPSEGDFKSPICTCDGVCVCGTEEQKSLIENVCTCPPEDSAERQEICACPPEDNFRTPECICDGVCMCNKGELIQEVCTCDQGEQKMDKKVSSIYGGEDCKCPKEITPKVSMVAPLSSFKNLPQKASITQKASMVAPKRGTVSVGDGKSPSSKRIDSAPAKTSMGIKTSCCIGEAPPPDIMEQLTKLRMQCLERDRLIESLRTQLETVGSVPQELSKTPTSIVVEPDQQCNWNVFMTLPNLMFDGDSEFYTCEGDPCTAECIDNDDVDVTGLEILDIRREGEESLLIRWELPFDLSQITGYEIYIDGELKSRITKLSRKSAVIDTPLTDGPIDISLYALSSKGRCFPAAVATYIV